MQHHDQNSNWSSPAAAEPEVSFAWLQSQLLRQRSIDASAGIVAFVQERLNFTVEPSQLPFLTSTATRGIVNCSRQWGKSTLAAMKAVFRAHTHPGSLILVLSPTLRQSGLFLSKVRSLAAKAHFRTKKDPDHPLSMRLSNGSLLVGLPAREANIRGFSAVNMIIIDEAARVPDSAYKAVRPMLAVSNGHLWLLSTPMGRRGFFHEEFEFGGNRWTRFSVPATACPERIAPSFLEEELEVMGPSWVKQEYFCTFVDNGLKVFDQQLVEDAVDADIKPLTFSAFQGATR